VCVCDFNGDVFRGVLTTTNVDDTQTLYKNNFHGWLTLCVCVSPNYLNHTSTITPLSPETPHRLARNKLNSHSQSPLSLLPPCIPLDSSTAISMYPHTFPLYQVVHSTLAYSLPWLHPHIIEPHLLVDDRI